MGIMVPLNHEGDLFLKGHFNELVVGSSTQLVLYRIMVSVALERALT